MEPVIKQSIGGTLSTYHYTNETAITASGLSAVTGAAYSPGGGALVSSTAITPAADGKMSLAISASAAGTAYEWCRAHFQYTISSQVYTQDLYFHIAKTEFDIPFHYADLIKFQPDLGDYLWSGDTKFYRQRDTAVSELYSRLLNAGRRPWLILNRSSLNIPLGWLWLHHVYIGLSKMPDDTWWQKAMDCREKFEDAFKAVNLLESDDDTANVSDVPAVPLSRTKLRRG